MIPTINLKNLTSDAILDQLISLDEAGRTAFANALVNSKMAQDEASKNFALPVAAFGSNQLDKLHSHLLDGGGVTDDSELVRATAQAVMDKNWPAVLSGMIHVFKSRMKALGLVRLDAVNKGVVYQMVPAVVPPPPPSPPKE